MKFTEAELERQRRAYVEDKLGRAVAHAIDVLEYVADNPLSSQEEYSGWCETLAEELRGMV